jgi:amino acid transporter, AAT family
MDRDSSRASADAPLARALKGRHLQLMGLGGAIGAGFFLGTGVAIHNAGPALLLAYLYAGAMVYLLMRALGEMAVESPSTGSFSLYTTRFLGPWWGFLTGWCYWLMNILIIMAELTAAGLFVRQLYPQVPQWLPTLAAAALVYGLNRQPVRYFGEVEFWLALVKVVTLVGVLVCALLILLGVRGAPAAQAGVANLWRHGGFLPKGFAGWVAAFPAVLFSFGGVEVPTLAAAETSRPETTLPNVIRALLLRVLLLYVGPLALVMMVLPWDTVDPHKSPFIFILQQAGLANAARIVMIVAVSAVVSAANSLVFASSRMLRSLAVAGHAPAFLRPVDAAGVPQRAVSICSIAAVIAVACNYVAPDLMFGELLKDVSWVALLVWSLIIATHLSFRRRIAVGSIQPVSYRLPGSPYAQLLVLGTFVMVGAELARSSTRLTGFCLLLTWLLLLALSYRFQCVRKPVVAVDPARAMER